MSRITERLPAGTGPAIERLRGYRAPVPRDLAFGARLRSDLLEAQPLPRRSLSAGWLASAWRPAGAVALAAVTVVGTGSYLRYRLHATAGSSGQPEPYGKLTPLLLTKVGTVPMGIAVDPLAGAEQIGRAYVTGGGGVTVIDSSQGTNLNLIAQSGHTNLIAVDAAHRRLYVVDGGGGLRILDDSDYGTARHTAAAGTGAYALAIDHRRGRVFVATSTAPNDPSNCNYGYVSTFDASSGALLNTVAANMPPGYQQLPGAGCATSTMSGPQGAAVDEVAGRLFVVARTGPSPQRQSDMISVLDSRSGALLRTVRMGSRPDAVAVDARTSRAFVTTAGGIAVLDSRRGTLLRTVTADGAHGIAIDAGRGLVFVAAGTQLLELDATTGAIRRAIPLQRDGSAALVAIDGHHGRIFVALLDDVAAGGKGALVMLDEALGTVVDSAQVGGSPDAMAVDSVHGRVFVVNEDDSTTSVFATGI